MTSLEIRFAEVWSLCLDDHSNAISDVDQEDRRLRLQKAFEGEQIVDDDPSMTKISEAVRELAGCRTQGRMREEAALFHLDPLLLSMTSPVHSTKPFNTWTFVPPPVSSAYAHSISAYAYFQKHMGTEEDLWIMKGDALLFPRLTTQQCPDDPVDNIYRAAVHARDAAALLFITPVVLKVGLVFRRILYQLRIDPDIYKHFRPLWRAVERRAREVLGDDIWYEAVIRGYDGISPQVECTGPKCSVVPSADQPLVPCKGGCPAYVKPRYCSPRCARQDWRRHNMICKSFPCELSPVLKFDTNTRNSILQRLTNDGPARGVELVDADELLDEWRDGSVHWAKAETASPYVSGRRVRWIGRRYD
ncbi:hypothetical protein C8Q79DRAFT_435645 [Trametes meyenii]|nr:hypothetical protein C8Q79DRAFT_435645 [Trametes meyenii]